MPGPWATLLLADLGAEVVKLEEPEAGDPLRTLAPGMFAALNRGKRSVALDLKTPAGAARLRELCATADVLVEGSRPGVLARLGFEPAQLVLDFPRLVVCSLSGYGQTGPLRDRAGHDIGYLALSGALSRCAAPDGVPRITGLQLADLFGGAQSAVVAILAALVERGRTGRGRTLDVALCEGATGLVLPHLAGGEDVLSGDRPCYRVYRCGDGRSIAVGALEPKFWLAFCAAVERPQWSGRAFDRDLVPELEALFATAPRDAWAARLGGVDCCAEPVLGLDELAAQPQHAARGVFLPGGGLRTFPALVPAGELPTAPAPAAGAHTDEVLAEWTSARR